MRSIALFLIALAIAAPAQAAPSIEQLVERAFRHPRSVAHTGTVRVTLSGPPRSTASVRVFCDGHGRERREHLDGPARGLTILTDGQSSWQRPSPAARWTALQIPPATSSWDRLRRNYRFRRQGEERIAGRKAAVIAIDPVHPGNPRQVLWLDMATALVLRADSYTYAGDLAMTTHYTTFVPKAPPARALKAPDPNEIAPTSTAEWWKECASEKELRQEAGTSVSLPSRLPPGYALVAYYLRGCRRGGTLPVVRYDDGLNALTLFITPGPGGRRRIGRGWGWGRDRNASALSQVAGQQVARVAHEGYTYILVGDHDPDGLEATLRSIR
ncbi:MAG TPA: sigma-E factor regulatory protein RseB domain-containing protein [Armatimonadota bacterium]|nr:hypothetical protein [Armatimonadota bacterium]HOM83565.1 sigma-E factor regulatory protein RseB domain-containing protein [Armatimonadota bacterium]HOQ27577.1 sigma-E factor regulatory protein RseB domain-containing protein [Armatimonadota bacterium]HPO74749.1 sigma-E factor regulatory protein RseB domain-containing protein [Armatimonadota bacterium]HPT98527.1 sigma-E factor regulatory protein RseB domain-containing protein [Armatimonadota bacterium]